MRHILIIFSPFKQFHLQTERLVFTIHLSGKINFYGSHVTVYICSVLNRADSTLYKVKLKHKCYDFNFYKYTSSPKCHLVTLKTIA